MLGVLARVRSRPCRQGVFLFPMLALGAAVWLLALGLSPRPGAAASLAVDTAQTASTYTLTVTLAGAGSGYVFSSPIGIDCGGNCSVVVASGAVVGLTASPDGNSTFAGWSGVCTGTSTCDVTMGANKVVTATFDPAARPNLTIGDLYVEPPYAAPGQAVTFTAVISNASDAPVIGSFGAAIADGTGHAFPFMIASLPARSGLVISATSSYPWPGTYAPWAEVDQFGIVTESNEGDNRREGSIVVGSFSGPPQTNLTVVKWVPFDYAAGPYSPETRVVPGQVVTYHIAYSNYGSTFGNPPSGATGVFLADRLPAGFSYVGISPPLSATVTMGAAGQTVGIDLGNLPVGAGGRIELGVQVGGGIPAGTVVTNVVEIGGNEPDRSLDDNAASAAVRVGPFPNLLAAGLTVEPASPTTGQPVSLTVTISNTTDVAVVGTFTVAFGSGLSTAYLPISGLTGGSAVTLVRNVTYQGPGWYYPSIVIDPDSRVLELDESDNELGTAVEVGGADLRPNLAIASIGREPLGPAMTGTPVTFTVEISNTTGMPVTQPFTVTLDDGRGPVDLQGNGLGAYASQTFAFGVVYLEPGWFYPSAAVDPGDAIPEQNEDDNVQFADGLQVYGPSLSADLSVGTAWSARAGNAVVWTVDLANSSSGRAAEGVVLTDTLPPGFVLAGWYDRPRTGWDTACACEQLLGDDVGFAVEPAAGMPLVLIRPLSGTLPAGYADTIVLTTTAPAGAVGTFTNTVRLASATPDPQPWNNVAEASATLVPVAADLHVAAGIGYQSGRTVAWSVDIANRSIDDAGGVVLTDTLPAGFTLAGWYDLLRTTWDPACYCERPRGGDVGFAVEAANGTVAIRPVGGRLPGGYDDTVVLTATAAAGLIGTFTNTVVITGTTADPEPWNNRAEAIVTIETPQPDLAVSTWWSARSGQTVVWNVEFRNDGDDASGVVVTDILPAGFTLVGWYDLPRLSWSSRIPIGDDVPLVVEPISNMVVIRPVAGLLPAGYRDTVALTTTASAGLVGIFTNTATITGTLPDRDAENNEAEATVTLELSRVDLGVDQSGEVAATGEVVWAIRIANFSAEDAQNAVVTDTLPAGFTLVSWHDTPRRGWDDRCGCDAPTGDDLPFSVQPVVGTQQVTIRPAGGVLPAGYDDQIVLTTTVAGPVPAVVVNRVEIASATPEVDPSNNVRVAGLNFGGADVGIATWLESFDGGTAVWVVRFWNDSPTVQAEGVVVTDTLPAGFTLSAWTVLTGTADIEPTAGTPTVLIRPVGGVLPPGADLTVRLTTTSATPAETATNTAVVGTTTPDLPENNRAIASFQPAAPSGDSQDVPLDAGWNLVTLPLAPTDALPASGLLGQLEAAGLGPTAVVRWRDGRWESYLAAFPLNDFDLAPGEAYFVRLGRGGVWTFVGQSFLGAPPIEISAGWTAIGLPANGPAYTAEDVLVELSGQGVGATHLVRWRQGMWESHVRGTGGPGFQVDRADDGQPRPTGYFVRSDSYTTWTPGR